MTAHSHGRLPAGVQSIATLPADDWQDKWRRIVVADGVKERLSAYAVFLAASSHRYSRISIPAHGVILLSGPPGTGKTTLAHGLADWTARMLAEAGIAQRSRVAVIDPHALPSDLLGASQRAVTTLFEQTLPGLASDGVPLLVILDEVEALAVSRSAASYETNPIDVHRATDAVLTGLDSLAARSARILVVATTNDVKMLDRAFISRVDLHEEIGWPSAPAIESILGDSLGEILGADGFDPDVVRAVARECAAVEMDARQVRKLVVRAVVGSGLDVALDPARLTMDALSRAVGDLRDGRVGAFTY